MARAAWLLLCLLAAPASAQPEACASELEVEASEAALAEALDVQLLQTATRVQTRGGAPDETNATAPAPAQGALANLTVGAQNLTDFMHSKAGEVTLITDALAHAQDQLRDQGSTAAELAARYAQAHAEATNASQSLQAYLARLAAARFRRDELRNQTEELQGRLSLLAPALQQSEDDLSALLQEMPWLEGVANTTNYTDAEIGRQLESANLQGEWNKAELHGQQLALQAAIHELNQLNDELRSIQGRMGSSDGGGSTAKKNAGQRSAAATLATAAVLAAAALAGARP